jgi:hypothetical protein
MRQFVETSTPAQFHCGQRDEGWLIIQIDVASWFFRRRSLRVEQREDSRLMLDPLEIVEVGATCEGLLVGLPAARN